MRRILLGLLLALFACFGRPGTAQAVTGSASETEALQLLGSEDHTAIARGIALLATARPAVALPVLTALDEGNLVRDASGKVFIKNGRDFIAAGSMEAATPEGSSSAISLNNASRRSLSEALSRLRLSSQDVELRRAAAKQLSEYPDERGTTLIRTVIDKESDTVTKRYLALALAKMDLSSDDRALRLAAARAIQDSEDISLEARLQEFSEKESDPEVKRELRSALQSVKSRIFLINSTANVIYGLSLGSVLVLAALGLAITFGLMRVINMAHGEMLMLGAYSTFFVREQFLAHAPGAADWYLAVAVPFAFATTFGIGVVLERLVIKHLYGRPLETLLATWGLSLVLIQLTRGIFGAQNVTVANPNWLSGGFELMPALVVPYSRLAVLFFTASVVAFVWFVLRGTSVGLKVRAVTQNREIAASLGIATHRVDMWTFGLGSGLAGLAGVALSQLGNVGPELGQQHIIDSFMVVVLGGVGNILGTISAGIGLGIANKVLEPSVGAVLGKILILGLLILFIQWRPQGIFALKGRAAEN